MSGEVSWLEHIVDTITCKNRTAAKNWQHGREFRSFDTVNEPVDRFTAKSGKKQAKANNKSAPGVAVASLPSAAAGGGGSMIDPLQMRNQVAAKYHHTLPAGVSRSVAPIHP